MAEELANRELVKTWRKVVVARVTIQEFAWRN
jgi:hypothetical protein